MTVSQAGGTDTVAMDSKPDEQNEPDENRLQRTFDRLLGSLDADDKFNPGDHVNAQDGACGTVSFDTSIQRTMFATKLTKILSSRP